MKERGGKKKEGRKDGHVTRSENMNACERDVQIQVFFFPWRKVLEGFTVKPSINFRISGSNANRCKRWQ